MSLTFTQIDELIIKAKALGVKEFEFEGLKVKFKDRNVPRRTTHKAKAQPPLGDDPGFVPLSPLADLTPEEILYFATPHYDVIQAEKQKKTQGSELNHGDSRTKDDDPNGQLRQGDPGAQESS
jgi:hypothetical protein